VEQGTDKSEVVNSLELGDLQLKVLLLRLDEWRVVGVRCHVYGANVRRSSSLPRRAAGRGGATRAITPVWASRRTESREARAPAADVGDTVNVAVVKPLGTACAISKAAQNVLVTAHVQLLVAHRLQQARASACM
jgi:hypothetical protein